MSVTTRRLRSVAAVALAAGLALGAAACSRADSGTTEDGKIRLVLDTFQNFGYDQALKDFQAANPNITVEHRKNGELRDFQPKLQQWLDTGTGAGDVVALEEGVLLGYLANADKFVNLFDHGGRELQSQFLSWKFERGMTPDGQKLVALGTDVGGLAMCYRRDLFQQAGLPTDRAEVSRLWPTWDAYIATGRQFKAKGLQATWLDSGTSMVQPYVMQNSEVFFYSKDNAFVGDTNPVVKRAWDLGLQMSAEGLTSKLVRWEAGWDAAFKNSAFATVPCPAWMTEGVIMPRAGDGNAGKWDVATIPGGSGNWGGSFLAVPAQTDHPREAAELAKYLTSKAGHLAAWKEAKAMPSTIAALEDPSFKDTTSAYFNNAPVGQIFSDSAKNMKPVYLGPRHQHIWEQIFERQMQAAEQGRLQPDAAWTKAVQDAKDFVAS